MGIRDLKIPKMKFKKMKMNIEEEFDKIDYEKLEKHNSKNRTTPYEDMTHYKTVKEFFMQSIEKYANRPCILEKSNHKEPYKTTTYEEFGQNVLGLGTALIHVLKLQGKRVIIIGETQIRMVYFLYGTSLWSRDCCTSRSRITSQ